MAVGVDGVDGWVLDEGRESEGVASGRHSQSRPDQLNVRSQISHAYDSPCPSLPSTSSFGRSKGAAREILQKLFVSLWGTKQEYSGASTAVKLQLEFG
jgi:hypothetical protein